MREKSKHQNFSMARFEKISLLWTNTLTWLTKRDSMHATTTDPSTNWALPTAISVMTAPMTEWVRSLISTLLIVRSPHRCGRCGFEPCIGHMWDMPSSACGCVRWFSWGTIFSPHLPIASSRYELNILKRDVNLNKNIFVICK